MTRDETIAKFGPREKERMAAGVIRVPVESRYLDSLEGVARDETELRYQPKNAERAELSEFRNLRELYVWGPTDRHIAEIAALESLEFLLLCNFSTLDLAPLARLKRLDTLFVIRASKLGSLQGIAQLTQLEVLLLQDIRGLSDISPLSNLSRLRSLGVEGDVDTAVHIETLAPLVSLTRLANLFLSAAKVERGGLESLVQMKQLRLLHCTAHFPEQQYWQLMDANPALKCSWFDILRENGPLAKNMFGRFRKKR